MARAGNCRSIVNIFQAMLHSIKRSIANLAASMLLGNIKPGRDSLRRIGRVA